MLELGMVLETGMMLELGMMLETGTGTDWDSVGSWGDTGAWDDDEGWDGAGAQVDTDPFPFLMYRAPSSSSQGANRLSLRLRTKLLVLN